MAWIEDINKDYKITTGDGVTYTVNWLNARRAMDFNYAIFNFKGVKGSLIDRREPMGRVYDVEIFFQGEDNLQRGKDFLESSENKKAWQISHPMYGPLYVHPISSLDFDDSSFNATRLTFRVMETIGAAMAKSLINPVDVIQSKKFATDAAFAQAFVTEIPAPTAADVSQLMTNVSTAERLQAAYATTLEDAETVANTFNAVNIAIDNAATDAFAAINGVQAMLNLPGNFIDTVFSRIRFLVRTGQALYAAATSITAPDLKKIYENNMAALIGTMCFSTVTNVTAQDYPNRGSVVEIIDTINTAYNEYLANLDQLQSANNGDTDSYIPDFGSINELNSLMYFTLSNLFSIAANAKQQRSMILADDSNVIQVAYDLYGLSEDDSTVTQVINDNNIGLNELLQLKKGRKIIYYV